MVIQEEEPKAKVQADKPITFPQAAKALLLAYQDSQSPDPKVAERGMQAEAELAGMMGTLTISDPVLSATANQLLASIHYDRTRKKILRDQPEALIPSLMHDMSEEEREAMAALQSLESQVQGVSGITQVRKESDRPNIARRIGETIGVVDADSFVIPDEAWERPAFPNTARAALNALVLGTEIKKDESGKEYMEILGDRHYSPDWDEGRQAKIGEALAGGYWGDGFFQTMWREGGRFPFFGFHIPPFAGVDTRQSTSRSQFRRDAPKPKGKHEWIEGIHYNVPTAFGTIPLVPNVTGNQVTDRRRLMDPIYARWILHHADPSFWLKARQALAGVGEFGLTIWGWGRLAKGVAVPARAIAKRSPVLEGLGTKTIGQMGRLAGAGAQKGPRLGLNFDVRQIGEEILYSMTENAFTGRLDYGDAFLSGLGEGTAEWLLGKISRGAMLAGKGATHLIPKVREARRLRRDTIASAAKALKDAGIDGIEALRSKDKLRKFMAMEGERLAAGKITRERFAQLFDAMWVGAAFGAYQDAQTKTGGKLLDKSPGEMWSLFLDGLDSEDALANMTAFGAALSPSLVSARMVGRQLTKEEQRHLRDWVEAAADAVGENVDGMPAKAMADLLEVFRNAPENASTARNRVIREAEEDPEGVQVPAPGLNNAADIDFATGSLNTFHAMLDGANQTQGVADVRDALRVTSDQDLRFFDSRLRSKTFEEKASVPNSILRDLVKKEIETRDNAEALGESVKPASQRAPLSPRGAAALTDKLEGTHFSNQLEAIRAVNLTRPDAAAYTSLDPIPGWAVREADRRFKAAAADYGYASALASEQSISETAASLVDPARREAVGSVDPVAELNQALREMLTAHAELYGGDIPQGVQEKLNEASGDPAQMRALTTEARNVLKARDRRRKKEARPSPVARDEPAQEAAELAGVDVSAEDEASLDADVEARQEARQEAPEPVTLEMSPGAAFEFRGEDVALGATGFGKRATSDILRMVYESQILRAGDPQAQAGVALGMLSSAYVPRGTRTARVADGLVNLVSAVTGVPVEVVSEMHTHLGSMPEAEVEALVTKAEDAVGAKVFQRDSKGRLREGLRELVSAVARGNWFDTRQGGETTWGKLKGLQGLFGKLKRTESGDWDLGLVADFYRRASQTADEPLMSRDEALSVVSDPDVRARWEQTLTALEQSRPAILGALQDFRPERLKDTRQRLQTRLEVALKDRSPEERRQIRDKVFDVLRDLPEEEVRPEGQYLDDDTPSPDPGPAEEVADLGTARERFSDVLGRLGQIVDRYLGRLHYRGKPWLLPDVPERAGLTLRLIAANAPRARALFRLATDEHGNPLYANEDLANAAFDEARRALQGEIGESWNVAYDLIRENMAGDPKAMQEAVDVFRVARKLMEPAYLEDSHGNEYKNPNRQLSDEELAIATRNSLTIRVGEDLALAPGVLESLEARLDEMMGTDEGIVKMHGGLSAFPLSGILRGYDFNKRLDENWAKRGLRRIFTRFENRDSWILKKLTPLIENLYTGPAGLGFIGGRPVHGGAVPRTEAEISRRAMRARIRAEAFFSDMMAEMEGITDRLDSEFTKSERNLIGTGIILGLTKRVRTPEALQRILKIPDLGRAEKMLQMMHEIVNHTDRVASEGVRTNVFSPSAIRAWRGQYLARVKAERERLRDASDRAKAELSPFRSGREAHRQDMEVAEQALDMIVDPSIVLPLQDHQELERIRAWSLITDMLDNGSFITKDEFLKLPEWRKKLYRKAWADEHEVESGRDSATQRRLTRNQLMLSAFFEREGLDNSEQSTFNPPEGRKEALTRIGEEGLYTTTHALDELTWMVDRLNRDDRGTVTEAIDALAREWRQRKTVQSVSYWTTNILSSITLNWVNGRAGIWDFFKGVAFGKGKYADAMRSLNDWQEYVSGGRDEDWFRNLSEKDPQRALKIKLVDRFVKHMGAGTFHDTVIDPVDGRRLQREMFSGDSELARTFKDFHLGEVIEVSTQRTGRAVAGFIDSYEARVAAALQGGSKQERIEAMKSLMAHNQFVEIYFKLAAAWETMDRYGGPELLLGTDDEFFSKVTTHAAQGTGDYNDRNTFLARASGSLNLWGLSTLEKDVLDNAGARFFGVSRAREQNVRNLARSFMHIPFTTWGVAMTGMGLQTFWRAKYKILGTLAMSKIAAMVAAAAFGDDEMTPEQALELLSEAHAGFDPFEGFTIADLDDELGKHRMSAGGYGDPTQDTDGDMGLTLRDWMKYKEWFTNLSTSMKVHAPKAGGETRTLNIGEYLRPASTFPGMGFARSSPGARAVAGLIKGGYGERVPYGTSRDYMGLLPSWFFGIKRAATDLWRGRKGKERGRIALKYMREFAEAAFGEVGPMSLLGRSGQRAVEEGVLQGQSIEDFVRGMRDPAQVVESPTHRAGRFLFETAFRTQAPPTYQAVEPELREKGWDRFLSGILPDTPAGAETDIRGREMSVLRRDVMDQLTKIVVGTYAVYRADGVGRGGLDKMLMDALDLHRDSPHGELVDEPKSLIGQYIRRAPKGVLSVGGKPMDPARVEDIYLRTAYKILNEETFTEARNSLMRIARAKAVDPAVFGRLWKASVNAGRSGQGEKQPLLDYVWRKVIQEKDYDHLRMYWGLYKDALRPELSPELSVGDNSTKQGDLRKFFSGWRGKRSGITEPTTVEKIEFLGGKAIDLAPSLFIRGREALTSPPVSDEKLEAARRALFGGR